MKIIVGLGNPGKAYQLTRHNVGFLTLDLLSSHYKLQFKLDKKFNALVADININNQKILFVKPQTFMNLSGLSVAKILSFYQESKESLLVISDDAALDIGRIRIRDLGSHGGQNGLRNIIEQLKTNQFARLRIGIGHNGDDLSNHVLSQFTKSEQQIMINVFDKAKQAVIDYIEGMSLNDLMNKYNPQT